MACGVQNKAINITVDNTARAMFPVLTFLEVSILSSCRQCPHRSWSKRSFDMHLDMVLNEQTAAWDTVADLQYLFFNSRGVELRLCWYVSSHRDREQSSASCLLVCADLSGTVQHAAHLTRDARCVVSPVIILKKKPSDDCPKVRDGPTLRVRGP